MYQAFEERLKPHLPRTKGRPKAGVARFPWSAPHAVRQALRAEFAEDVKIKPLSRALTGSSAPTRRVRVCARAWNDGTFTAEQEPAAQPQNDPPAAPAAQAQGAIQARATSVFSETFPRFNKKNKFHRFCIR